MAGNSGNVGIGTSTPTSKIDTAGKIKLGNASSICNATSWVSISGKLIQRAYAEITTYSSTTATILFDDTIPKITAIVPLRWSREQPVLPLFEFEQVTMGVKLILMKTFRVFSVVRLK